MPTIKIDTSRYEAPTEEDIREAKKYILDREHYSDILGDLILNLLKEASRDIAAICYKYGISAKDFQISANDDMRREVYAVMDVLEDEILELIEDYATECTDEEDRKAALIAWMALLGSKGRGLRETLVVRLRQFLYDLEAQIAAMLLAGYPLEKAIERIIDTLTKVYISPEVKKAILKPLNMVAMYIRSRGIHEGGVGQSSSGANNVVNFGKQTLNLTWMKEQQNEFEEDERIVGYYQLRGSTYHCDVCDSLVGFHKLEGEFNASPMVHPNCCCYRVPIYKKGER